VATIDDAYRRFSTERFPLPNQSAIEAMEQRIGVKLPEDYRRFVLEFNGGYFNEPLIESNTNDAPTALLTCLHGIGAAHPSAELGQSTYLDLFTDNDPPKILPIGSTPTGGLIVLSTDNESWGEIYLKVAYGGFHYLAADIGDFFDLLREPR
jgi:hypothetical protein